MIMLGQGIEVGYSSCNVCEWSYRWKGMTGIDSSWRHNFQRSLGKFSSPSPFPSANHPFCDPRLHSLDLQFIVVQFTLGTVVDGTRCGSITETSLEGPQFLLKSCRLLTQEEFLFLGRLWRSYFLWYLIYGGLHEEDVSGKGKRAGASSTTEG